MPYCKTCGKKAESDFCFLHKQRKPLSKKSSFLSKKLDKETDEDRENTLKMRQLFLDIWKKRLHLSEVSGLPLIGEVLSSYFHHILPKEKYPKACLDEENIILLTLGEHDQVEMDMYRYEEINRRREQLEIKYNL